MNAERVKCAILGSGNIATDLMIKIIRNSKKLQVVAMAGIDPRSDGLARASKMGLRTTSQGVKGLVAMDDFPQVQILFDATSAKAHEENYEQLSKFPKKKIIDLTPAALGPFMVPVVNFDRHQEAQNVNMVSCGGQATIPVVAAVSRVCAVHYAEIVASIASRSAGPGTRANIDEFTATTAQGLEQVGGAQRGKAIIILNPAEPPIVMRDTVFTLSEPADQEAIRKSIRTMIKEVQQYVPGYKLHQEIQFDLIPKEMPVFIQGLGHCHGLKTTVLLEVTGAGHYLPAYAGNLDIMTSAALATGEKMADRLMETQAW